MQQNNWPRCTSNYDPYWIKEGNPTLGGDDTQLGQKPWWIACAGALLSKAIQYIKTVDYVTEEFTLEEQAEIATKEFMKVPKFHFLLATSRDGSLSRTLRKVNILRQVEMIPFPILMSWPGIGKC